MRFLNRNLDLQSITLEKKVTKYNFFIGSHQGQDQVYYPEESGFSKCVNSFFQWGQALVATAATAVSTTLKETTTSLITSSLNPNAQVFTPAKPAMEAPEIINPPDVNTKEIHSVEKSKIVPDELQNHENTEISSNCNNNTSSIEKQQNMVRNLKLTHVGNLVVI